MKYVFGPVPSRRLGQSLGIDPIPMKTCNWNCVYCQLGRTSPLSNTRQIYAPAADLIEEVRGKLESQGDSQIDWLTFVGSGEPTLHTQLGWMIEQLKSLTTIPLAVITNGSLLYLDEVRHDLRKADLVIPSVDAGSERLYRKINRAVAELTFDRLVTGLADFRAGFAGRIWAEVMLIEGLNSDEQALRDLAAVLDRIQPDEVHINLPVRPPSEPWVRVASDESIARATEILGRVARVVQPSGAELRLEGCEDVVEAIVNVITRHPMSEEDLHAALVRWNCEQVEQALRELEASGRAHVVSRRGQRFWSGADARYVDDAMSRCHGAPDKSSK